MSWARSRSRWILAVLVLMVVVPCGAQLRNCQKLATTPTANDDYVVWSGGPVIVDVLGNDYDDDGDFIAIASFTSPGQGTVDYNDEFDALVYTPSSSSAVMDSFTYTISDGQFGDTATVRLSANPPAPPPPPPPVARVRIESSCNNLTCYFRAILENVDDAPRFFHWNFGTGTTPPYYSIPTAVADLNPGDNSVTVTVTFVSGRQLVGTASVTTTPPQIRCTFSVSNPASLAPVARVTYLSNSNDPGFLSFRYYWDWNDGGGPELADGSVVLQNTYSHRYRTEGPRIVNFLIKTQSGLTVGECPQPVNVQNVPPTIDFTAQAGNGVSRPKKFFTFNASPSDEYYNELGMIEWNFGDGTFSTNGVGTSSVSTTGQLMTHQYTRPGNYVVIARVTDFLGAVGTVEKTIAVDNEPPTAGWTFACRGRTCKFDAGLSNDDGEVLTYRWNFGDGSVPVSVTSVATIYTFAAGGAYDVTLTVDDGTSQASKTLRVSPRAGPVAASLLYYSLPPCRLFDSRVNDAPLTNGTAAAVQVAGLCGIPVEAKAVAINATVYSPTSAGSFNIYPAGGPVAPANTIDFTPQRSPRANSFIVLPGSGGAVTAMPAIGNGGTAHLTVDVTGYFSEARSGSPLTGGPLRAAAWYNARYFDTAQQTPALKTDTPRSFLVRGQVAGGGIPLDAEAAWLNVTAVNPTSSGSLALYPSGGSPAGTSSLNVQSPITQMNGSIMALGGRTADDLTIVYSGAAAGSATDVQVDSALWFNRSAKGLYHAIEPCRAVDTRQAGNGAPRIPANFSQRVFTLAGNCGVPPDDGTPVLGVAAVVRIINADSAGSVLIGGGFPDTRTIHFQAGETIANTVFLGETREVRVTLMGGGIDLVIDVVGYFQSEENHNPTANPDSINAVVRVPITVNVIENDSDVDGESIRLSPTNAILNPPVLGKAERASDNSITYSTESAGFDAFDYLLVDGRGGTAVGHVLVDARVTAEAPYALNDSATGVAGTPIDVNVLANDADPNNEPIRLTDAPIIVPPSRGTVSRLSDTTLRYQSSQGGTETLTYEIINGRGLRARAQLTVTVNRPPVAANDTAIVQGTTPVTIDVLANDSDPDGDRLLLANPAIVSPPTNGTAVVHADGRRITYTTQTRRPDAFKYAAVDRWGQQSSATVTITPNGPPIANADSFAVITNAGAVDLNVTANDSDPDPGDVVKLTADPFRALPSRGTVTRKNDSTVTYVPTAGTSGSDAFTAQVTDGRGGVATGNVALTLCSAGVAITASPTSRTIRRGELTTLSVMATGPSLTYQWYLGPSPSITTPVGNNSPQLTVSPLVTSSHWVRVSNPCAFSNSAAAVVTVLNNAPVPLATFNCRGAQCDLSALSSRDDSGIAAYGWTLSDVPATVFTSSTVQHAFPSGCHVATLAVTDNEGARATTQQTIAAGDVALTAPYRSGGASADTHALSYLSAAQEPVNTTGNLNGILEPGERVVVEPTWAASVGTSLYNTTAKSVTSPHPSITATVLSKDASYSTVNGAANCWANGKCYVVEAKAVGTRGTPHIDLSLTEAPAVPSTSGNAVIHVGSSFFDVPPAAPYYGAVESVTHWGLTGGCGNGNFCPGLGMTRAMIQVWLLIAKYGPGYQPPACGAPPFPDVECSYWAAAWIAQAKAEKWTATSGNFLPEKVMSRGEQAVFILKALNPTANPGGYQPPACGSAPYSDVPCSHWAAPWIADLKARNLAIECSANRFCPDDDVNRVDSAQSVVRAYSLAIDRRICTTGPVYVSSAPPALPDPVITNSSPALGAEWAVQNIFDDNPNTDYASNGAGTDTFIDFDFGAPVLIREVTVTDRKSAGGANGSGAGANTNNVTAFRLIFSTDATFGNSDDILVPVSSPNCCDTTVTQVNGNAGLTVRYVRYDVVSISGNPQVGAADIAFRAYNTSTSGSSSSEIAFTPAAETPPGTDPPPIPTEAENAFDGKEGRS